MNALLIMHYSGLNMVYRVSCDCRRIVNICAGVQGEEALFKLDLVRSKYN